MAPFFYLPHVLFVAEHGLGHFELSMRAQYELTKRFSAESSIRPCRSRTAQDLLVDLAVHFVKASGDAAPKVFTLKRVTLPPRGRVDLRTSISMAVHTTRKPRPGRHAVDVIVNGAARRVGSFDVVAARR